MRSACPARSISRSAFWNGYYDENAYFHSPLDYLPDLDDGWFLDQFRRTTTCWPSGNDDPLFDQNVKLAHEFGVKQIPHVLDVWEGFGHDWPWWHQMAEKFFFEWEQHEQDRRPLRDGGIVPSRPWWTASTHMGVPGRDGGTSESRRRARWPAPAATP